MQTLPDEISSSITVALQELSTALRDDSGEDARERASPEQPTLSPTMVLAIQSVLAAVAAGLITRAVGNEQSLVVAWTAFVIIAGSAVHTAYQRPTPLLSELPRRLHGSSDDHVALGIGWLRDALARAAASARGEAGFAAGAVERPPPIAGGAESLGLADSLRLVEELHVGLSALGGVLRGPA